MQKILFFVQALCNHKITIFCFWAGYQRPTPKYTLYIQEPFCSRGLPEKPTCTMSTLKISLTYPGYEDDKALAEKIYAEYPNRERFEQKVAAMKHKQRLFEGDRSHPDVQLLDNTTFTYKGWEADKDEAERRLTGDCTVLQLGSYKSLLLRMKKTEALYSNRGSIDCLQELDSIDFSYPGWQIDKTNAEKIFTDYPTTHRFQEKVTTMKNKQRLYNGDRSHPVIVALDETIFTYPEWEEDRKEAEKRHCGDCTLFQLGVSCNFLYDKMVKKQRMHENREHVAVLKELDSIDFSYPGWEKDKQVAEQYFAEFSTTDRFYDKVTAMKNKQRLYNGDQSHPEIAALDSIQFTYEGWEEDKVEAVRRHTGDCTVLQLGSFDVILEKMKKRQGLNDNRTTVEDLVGLDAMLPCTSDSCSKKSSPMGPITASLAANIDIAAGDWEQPLSKRDRLCVVCLDHEPSFAFIPCGHLCICSGCVSEFDSSTEGRDLNCPICRKCALCVTRIFST